MSSTITTLQALLDARHGKHRIRVTQENYGVRCSFSGGAIVVPGNLHPSMGETIDALSKALDAELARGPSELPATDLSWLEPLRDLVQMKAVTPEDASYLFKLVSRPVVFAEMAKS